MNGSGKGESECDELCEVVGGMDGLEGKDWERQGRGTSLAEWEESGNEVSE